MFAFMYLCMFYLFNLFCGIVLEKEKKEKFFIQLNQKTLSTSKETLKILVDLNAVVFPSAATASLQSQLLKTEAGECLSPGFQGYLRQHRKTLDQETNIYTENKVIIFKCRDIMNINLFT